MTVREVFYVSGVGTSGGVQTVTETVVERETVAAPMPVAERLDGVGVVTEHIGTKGLKGDKGDPGSPGPVEIYDSNTVPTSPTFPYLRFERDAQGDVQTIYLGTAT